MPLTKHDGDKTHDKEKRWSGLDAGSRNLLVDFVRTLTRKQPAARESRNNQQLERVKTASSTTSSSSSSSSSHLHLHPRPHRSGHNTVQHNTVQHNTA
jgi:hypothetical protein